MRVCVIIPAYNEAQTLGEVIGNLLPLEYGIVVVDDGSRDGTAEIARAAGAIALKHCVNLGQGAALQTGMDYARRHKAQIIVTFDADGQHSPADIPVLLHALDMHKADIVLGSRFLGRAPGIGFFKKYLLKLAVVYTNATTGVKLTDTHNGLRALNVATTGRIRLTQNRMAHASELLHQVAEYKLRYVEVPCTIAYTNYSCAKGQKLSGWIHIVMDQMIGRLAR